jgi:hypothetical protein
MQVTLNPAVTTTVIKEVSPATVTITVPLDAALWLMAFAGKHNGDMVNNPLSGLYQKLGEAMAVDYKSQDYKMAAARMGRAVVTRTDGVRGTKDFTMDVHGHSR